MRCRSPRKARHHSPLAWPRPPSKQRTLRRTAGSHCRSVCKDSGKFAVALDCRTIPTISRGFVLGEARLQLGTEYAWRGIEVDFTGDLVVDGVLEEFEPDLRRLRLTWSPVESMDLRLGRQILTWGKRATSSSSTTSFPRTGQRF